MQYCKSFRVNKAKTKQNKKQQQRKITAMVSYTNPPLDPDTQSTLRSSVYVHSSEMLRLSCYYSYKAMDLRKTFINYSLFTLL